MKQKILTLALCACSANIALAAESLEPQDPSRAQAMTGLVLGVQAGFASGFNPPDTYSGTSGNVSLSNSSGGFNFGGFIGYDVAINKMFSVGAEIDLNYTPNIYSTSFSTPVESFDGKINILNIPIMLTGKFVTPVGVNVFVKGGLNYQRADVDVSCSGAIPCSNIQSNSAWTGVLAGGVGYQIDTINIFAQYMYIFGKDLQNWDDNDNKAIEQGILTAGVSVTLPM